MRTGGGFSVNHCPTDTEGGHVVPDERRRKKELCKHLGAVTKCNHLLPPPADTEPTLLGRGASSGSLDGSLPSTPNRGTITPRILDGGQDHLGRSSPQLTRTHTTLHHTTDSAHRTAFERLALF